MKFTLWWKVFTFFIFGLICIRFVFLSKKVIYRGYEARDPVKIEFEIDLCYKNYISYDYCKTIDGSDHVKSNKTEFRNKLEKAVGCYTKNFRSKTAKQIVVEFESWKIENLSSVQSASHLVRKIDIGYLLFDQQVCVKHKFEIDNQKKTSAFDSIFVIKNSQKNQKFDGYMTLKKGKYATKKTHFIQRSCWEEGIAIKSNRCTETGKNITFNTIYYSSKLSEYHETDCVKREDSNANRIFQNDCYENCIKNERKYHRLTYKETDDFLLDYNETSNSKELKDLLEGCSNKCIKVDCETIAFYIRDVEELISENDNHEQDYNFDNIIIDLRSTDFRVEAVPLHSITKLLWMIVSLSSIFFGLNIYGFIFKNFSVKNFLAICKNKRKRRKSQKYIMIISLLMIISFSFCFVLEAKLFDFGKESNNVYSKKESISERSLTLSICFDFCDILNEDIRSAYTGCNDEMMNKTIKELDEMTWNVEKFKEKASMRNSAVIHPIRQDDYDIQMFFRGFKKCFLMYYETKKYWNHFPLQRFSRLHVNVTDVQYTFYVEDGFHYPKINSSSTKKSVLHRIEIFKRKSREGCISYRDYFGDSELKTRDDFIQNCVIERRASKLKTIPTNVNLRINNESLQYSNLHFSKDDSKEMVRECEEEFKLEECEFRKTSMTYKRTFGDKRDNISINLTPFIYEFKPVDDESTLIVSNRIFSFLIILTGFSIRDYLTAIFSIYFVSFCPLYSSNVQLAKRIFYLIMSWLFLIHFSFVFIYLINPMTETAFHHFVDEIEVPVINFCYKTDIDLSHNNYTLEKLDNKTVSFAKILDEILIYEDQNKVSHRLKFENFKKVEADPSFYETTYHGSADGSNATIFGNLFYMYFDDLKCLNFKLGSGKSSDKLGVHYKKLQKLISVSINLTQIDDKKKFIFLSRPGERDFDWNLPLSASIYNYEIVNVEDHYKDHYFLLKNFFSWFKNLVGLFRSTNDVRSYLLNLRDSFEENQYAATTLISFDYPRSKKNLIIKNSQFNAFIQFRSIASNKNDYYFTQNVRKGSVDKIFYIERNDPNQNLLKITLYSSLIKFQVNTFNRYQIIELIHHLAILIVLYFKIDFINLPKHFQKGYPYLKFFALYTMYHITGFLIFISNFIFRFIKILQIRNDY